MNSYSEPLHGGSDWFRLDVLQKAARAEQIQKAWWENRDELIAQAHREGHSLQSIAAAVDLHVNTVARICRWAEGKPAWKRGGATTTRDTPGVDAGATPGVVPSPDDPAVRARAFAEMVGR